MSQYFTNNCVLYQLIYLSWFPKHDDVIGITGGCGQAIHVASRLGNGKDVVRIHRSHSPGNQKCRQLLSV